MALTYQEGHRMSSHLLSDNLALYATTFASAFLIALWVSLVLWTFRDIRSRTRDIIAIFLAMVIVLIFTLPGLLLYFFLRPNRTLEEVYQASLEEEAMLASLAGRITCPGCSRVVDPDWIVCPSCSTRLRKPCGGCKRPLELSWVICPYCATPSISADIPPQK
jgi:RNA polymerase subunit RPABC4/transcription elongation factor Spt4